MGDVGHWPDLSFHLDAGGWVSIDGSDGLVELGEWLSAGVHKINGVNPD